MATVFENHNTVEKTQITRLTTVFVPIGEKRRFLLLLLAIYLSMCTSFGSYIFNITSGGLQELYNLTQADLTAITTCGMMIGYIVLPYSFVYDYFGPLPIEIISCIVFPLGALLMGLSFQGIVKANVVRLCVFYSMTNVGTTYYDLIASMTLVTWFPTHKGPVVALLKTFVNLGAAIVGSMYVGFFRENPIPMFYTLMAFALLLAIITCIVLRFPAYHLTGYEEKHLKPEERERRRAIKASFLRQRPPTYRFVIGIVVLCLMIVYLPTSSAVVAYHNVSQTAKDIIAIFAVLLGASFILMALPYPTRWDYKGLTRSQLRQRRREAAAAVAAVDEARREHYARLQEQAAREGAEEGEEEERTSDAAAAVVREGSNDGAKPARAAEAVLDDDAEPVAWDEDPHGARHPDGEGNGIIENLEGDGVHDEETEIDFIAPQYQTSFLRNLLSVELWCLLWTGYTFSGPEGAIMQNAAFIFGALSQQPVSNDLRSLLTVLNGVGGAVGTVAMAAFEFWSQNKPAKDRIPITITLYFSSVTIVVALVLLLALPGKALPLPYVLSAISHGANAGTGLLVCRTMYAKDLAKHYHWGFIATALASLTINRFLYGEYYTRRARRYDDLVCLHRDCVQVPLIVCLAIAVTGIVSTTVLHLRYRSYCIRVIAERERLRALANGDEEEDAEEAEEAGDAARERGHNSSGDALYDPLAHDRRSSNDGDAPKKASD